MPDGAQAWKMIKTPGSHTDRIAQACDRCRSKKIRCDGLRPHCSQCLTVGFECKISDKLTRRAFPRGYTESLEDRIRQLESENTRLSNLLDVKDEQMEMLSRVEAVTGSVDVHGHNIHNHNNYESHPHENNSHDINNGDHQIITPESAPLSSKSFNSDSEDDDFVVNQMNKLGMDGTYRGTSAGGVFIDAFVQKLKSKNPQILSPVTLISAYFTQTTSDSGVIKNGFASPHPSSYSYNYNHLLSPPASSSPESMKNTSSLPSLFPSRLSCDKLVTIYFQEWQSAYAIVDQTAFLEEYERFFEEEETEGDNNNRDGHNELFAASLALILCLACLANKDGSSLNNNELWKLDSLWKRIMSHRVKPSLHLLQVGILAQLYSLHVGNLDDVWHYRMLTTSLALRLGLHRSRKFMTKPNGDHLTAYEAELSRRVFWVVYTLDVFASAVLGSPRLLNDSHIQCCMPRNIDEEVVNQTDSSSMTTPPPSSPESCADLSSASNSSSSSSVAVASCQLSIIHLARILANILDTIYSPKQTYHHPKTVLMLDDQLESWRRELPPSLKFDFVNGMPTASLSPVHQKSPLLLMLYHYCRVLIHLPATTAPVDDSSSTTYTSGSIVAVMQSAKTYVQIYNYLKARNVTSTLPLSPTRMIFLLGSIILYCAMDYSKGGALLQQSRKLLSQSLGYIYTDMQVGLPGSISGECFQWLEEICDVVLNGPVPHRKSSSGNSSSSRKDPSSNGSNKTKATSEKQQLPPQQEVPQVQVKIENEEYHQYEPEEQLVGRSRNAIHPQQRGNPRSIIDTNTANIVANILDVIPVPPLSLQQQQQQEYANNYKQTGYYQQPSSASNSNSALSSSAGTVVTRSPVEDFFDTSSFEDFDALDMSGILDPAPGTIRAPIKHEDAVAEVSSTSTNTFLDNFNWDDSYNWSSLSV